MPVEIKFTKSLPVIQNWGEKRLREEMDKVGRNPQFAPLAALAQTREQREHHASVNRLKQLKREFTDIDAQRRALALSMR